MALHISCRRQFFYVAAQTGIFSFFINYAVTDIPVIKQNLADSLNALPERIRVSSYPAAMLLPTDVVGEIKKSPELMKNVEDFATLLQKDTDPRTQPISQFIWAQFSKENQKLLSEPATADPAKAKEKQSVMISELNRILEQNPHCDLTTSRICPACSRGLRIRQIPCQPN